MTAPKIIGSLAIMVLVWATNTAEAATRALLIGVSDYDNSIGLADLRGPANDVRLMQRVLTERGLKDIRILADGVVGSQVPNRDAIMAALNKLTADSTDGDLVIIHLSGHGTRQIDGGGDELDGFDEVFLPADVARAPNDSGLIPNAIRDEEIGAAVRNLRRKGADVWTIMDFCHAGTGLRSGGGNTASRFVDPSVLGTASKQVTISPDRDRWFIDTGQKEELKGGLIAFYAAQAHEVAREVNFSAGEKDQKSIGQDNGWYGLFTSKIANRLQASPGITYLQLFQAVLSDMNDSTVPGGARLQTPAREGNLWDATVLGGKKSSGVKQYPIEFDELRAGKVHGIAEGTIVELFADAAASKGEGVGFAQVEEARTTLSFLRPVTDQCSADASSLCERTGDLPDNARFARIVLRPVTFSLSLSPVIDLRTGRTADTALPAVTALTNAIKQLQSKHKVPIISGETDYSIEVGFDGDRLWFGRSVLQGKAPVGLSWHQGDMLKLEQLLLRMLDAEGIASTMDAIADTASPLSPSPVDVTVAMRASNVELLEKQSGRIPPARECRRVQRREAYSPAAPMAEQALLKQCDMLRPSAKALEAGQFDVNVIHIDSQFCARSYFTRIDGLKSVVALGSPMIICSDCPGGVSTGNERLYVLKTKAIENADKLDLSQSLATCKNNSATRSVQSNALQNLIDKVGREPGTRGAFGGMAPGDVWVERFEWNVVPRHRIPQLKSR